MGQQTLSNVEDFLIIALTDYELKTWSVLVTGGTGISGAEACQRVIAILTASSGHLLALRLVGQTCLRLF